MTVDELLKSVELVSQSEDRDKYRLSLPEQGHEWTILVFGQPVLGDVFHYSWQCDREGLEHPLLKVDDPGSYKDRKQALREAVQAICDSLERR